MEEAVQKVGPGDSQRAREVKILVVDDDPVLLRMVETFLKSASGNYNVLTANSGPEALDMARREVPDLILLDLMMPGMDGIAVCERLRSSRSTYLIPVIMLTASASQIHRLDALRTGVDDYVSKPFDPEELEARIQGLIRRIEMSRASNPLTGLPGNLAIEHEINKRLARDDHMACCYLDLDNFKALNDHYGFEKGDECIKLVAQVLIEAAEASGHNDDFVGHIGGDDFIYISRPDYVEDILNNVTTRFDELVRDIYTLEDRERGYIEVKNRQEEVQQFPITTLSIGVSTNERRNLTSALQVSEIATELKRAAKAKAPGRSHFIIDRRTS
ncbi:MAG: response regulator [Candidatus Eremiobacteraeota bacterium]|nr:response regulator [Candidatus Eremiobacteraeota bacterium]